MSANVLPIDKWRKLLVFSIGASNRLCASQLPNVHAFPAKLPISHEMCTVSGDFMAARDICAWNLGIALGIASLKFGRGCSAECYGPRAELDGLFLDDLQQRLKDMRALPYGEWLCFGYIHILSLAIELALQAPERLPMLHARVDALSNDELHRMAMEAIQDPCKPSHILSDLMAPTEAPR